MKCSELRRDQQSTAESPPDARCVKTKHPPVDSSYCTINHFALHADSEDESTQASVPLCSVRIFPSEPTCYHPHLPLRACT